MPSNLEIKATIQSIESTTEIAHLINASYAGKLFQIDTYFNVPHGRLKLREIERSISELIYYERAEESYQRVSNFERYPCLNPVLLKLLLVKSLGIKATVEKKRLLFMYNTTRIHIDEVTSLGSFIEFESPIESSLELAQNTINFLVDKFNIKESEYVKSSYLDLLLKNVFDVD
jgi:adenylate cyclase class 2